MTKTYSETINVKRIVLLKALNCSSSGMPKYRIIADYADYKTQNQLSQILLEVDELANGIFSYYQDNGDDLAHTDKIQILAKKYFNVLD